MKTYRTIVDFNMLNNSNNTTTTIPPSELIGGLLSMSNTATLLLIKNTIPSEQREKSLSFIKINIYIYILLPVII